MLNIMKYIVIYALNIKYSFIYTYYRIICINKI